MDGVITVYLKKIATHHAGISPYHHRIGGAVERLNGILGGILGKLLADKTTKLWVGKVFFTFRSSFHFPIPSSSSIHLSVEIDLTI
jgi:hypothetical protein